MHHLGLYLLFVASVVVPAAVGTRRGFARARGRGMDRNPGPEGSYAWDPVVAQTHAGVV